MLDTRPPLRCEAYDAGALVAIALASFATARVKGRLGGKGAIMSKETPKDDPRKKTDPETFKQTDEPWKGNPEKEQAPRSKPDLEKWQRTNTH